MTRDELPALLPDLLPRLWAFALRLAADRHDAEDLVQRACVRALERRHQWQPGTSALSWMFSIVHSIWIDEIRARQIRSRSRTEWDESLVETVADPVASDPSSELLYREVLAAVDALPDAQRIVMLLVAIEGMSYREAAEILEIPIGTVMSRLSRARLTIGAQFSVPSPRVADDHRFARKDPIR
jgi:RNA polymerase sigma-70 factor, ECF subfamily